MVGAGNSGAEIAIESAGAHQVWLSGPDVGAIPFRMGGLPSRLLLERLTLRVMFHRVLTVRTPMGRKMRARMGSRATPLIRIRPKEITDAGVERVARVAGVKDGLPVLDLVGLHFLYAMSSAMIQGAGRDAEFIARHIAARMPSARHAKEPVAA